MTDNPKQDKNALGNIDSDMNKNGWMPKPSDLIFGKKMEQMLESVHHRHWEIPRISGIIETLPNIQKIVDVTCRLQELMGEATAVGRIAESNAAAHRSWLEPTAVPRN